MTIQKLQKWSYFWIHKLLKCCSFWIQKLQKWTSLISGSRNRQNGAISGSRNRKNGRQILYAQSNIRKWKTTAGKREMSPNKMKEERDQEDERKETQGKGNMRD